MRSLNFKMLILAGIFSLACTTKVSEWVLLNTIPIQYTLVYYHNAMLSESQKQQNSEITKDIKDSNVFFKNVQSKEVTKPYYALYYNERLFSKYNDFKELDNLTSSPLREKIAEQLMAGKLCIMLYLKTGDDQKDNSSLQILKKTVASSPFGEIITIVELSRNDINEKHFVSMLLNVEDDLSEIKEPMLFGIFGRFKALEPLMAKGINEENINLLISFLTSDCSCLIKDDLPGTDILFTNNWENPAPALVNAILDANPSLMHL